MLYAALKKNLHVQSTHENVRQDDSLQHSDSEDSTSAEHPTTMDDLTPTPTDIITEEEAQMAVHLTEFFQEQRKVYEQVRLMQL